MSDEITLDKEEWEAVKAIIKAAYACFPDGDPKEDPSREFWGSFDLWDALQKWDDAPDCRDLVK